MASRVAQFDGAPPAALAAGGVGGQERARVRVAAHALCWRLAVGLWQRVGPSHCARVWAGGWRQRLVGA